MNTKRTTIMTLATIALALGIGGVADANAGLRIDARIHVGGGHTHIIYGSPDYGRVCLPPLQVRQGLRVRVTRADRQIAARLARYTGVSSRKLLRLKRQGYRWQEIGRWLGLPHKTIRMAMDGRRWHRFLREDARRCRQIDRQSHRRHTAMERWDG